MLAQTEVDGAVPIRFRAAFVILILITQLTNGCASAPVVSRGDELPAVAAWTIPPSEFSTRRLYRLSYAGEQGQANLRVALFLLSDRKFFVSASDAFGRSIWDLTISPEGSRFVDHRNDRFCDIDEMATLPGLALESFPIRSLPSVLLGRLPLPPKKEVVSRDGKVSFQDLAGRNWTARVVDGSVRNWTLWLDGEPSVWWSRRQSRGGVLSHRQGGQIRWKEVVAEKFDENFSIDDPPMSYQHVDCVPADLSVLEVEPTYTKDSDQQ